MAFFAALSRQFQALAVRDAVETLVGIDHGLPFPLAYFDRHRLPRGCEVYANTFRIFAELLFRVDRNLKSIRKHLGGVKPLWNCR
jgi:hypothetical protein